jgi:hypothetical protein
VIYSINSRRIFMAITPTFNLGDICVIGNVWRIVGTLDEIDVDPDDCILGGPTTYVKDMQVFSKRGDAGPQSVAIQINTDVSGTKNGTCRINVDSATENNVEFVAHMIL